MIQDEVIKDIHRRLGAVEKDTKQILANTESMKWTKWHIRTLWAAVLALLGMKGVGH